MKTLFIVPLIVFLAGCGEQSEESKLIAGLEKNVTVLNGGKMKKLENLGYAPNWVTHLGCIKGCLDYLGRKVTSGWLMGATGYAFVINIHPVLCPSGPTAWKTKPLFINGLNIGYSADGVYCHKSEDGFKEKQKQAFDHVKAAIDKGLPCYGWELEIPEFFVINGYDETGYYYVAMDGSNVTKGPKPWEKLGDTGIGWLEVYSVTPIKPADDTKTVKDALQFALKFNTDPGGMTHEGYTTGLAAYDAWIKALETETAGAFGTALNTEVWQLCRYRAVEFLKEAKERIGGDTGPLFDEAAGHYDVVAKNLQKVLKLFPFSDPNGEYMKDKKRCAEAVEALKAARAAEEKGMEALGKIVAAL